MSSGQGEGRRCDRFDRGHSRQFHWPGCSAGQAERGRPLATPSRFPSPPSRLARQGRRQDRRRQLLGRQCRGRTVLENIARDPNTSGNNLLVFKLTGDVGPNTNLSTLSIGQKSASYGTCPEFRRPYRQQRHVRPGPDVRSPRRSPRAIRRRASPCRFWRRTTRCPPSPASARKASSSSRLPPSRSKRARRSSSRITDERPV